MKKIAGYAIIFLFTLSLSGQAEVYSKSFESYFSTCERALHDLDCLGASVAVIHEDRVIFLEGFGVRDNNSKLLVNTKTLFPIGSITKGMVTAVLSLLVTEKKISWDDYVVDYLPNFRMSDPWVSKEIRIRDLLCHWSGLHDHAGDLLFLNQSHDEMVENLSKIKITSGFRTSFAYQNLLYLVAGQVIKVVTGEKWEELVEKHFLYPLGMRETITSVAEVSGKENVALGHLFLKDGLHTIPWEEQVDFGPAGSICSNAWEMAQWIRYLLKKENFSLSSDWDVQPLQDPQVFLPMSPWTQHLYRNAHFMGCGMGWFSFDYFGYRILEHSGNLPGLSAKIALVPEKKIGVIVCCNQHESLLPHALMMEALDRALETPSVDWVRRISFLSAKPRIEEDFVRKVNVSASRGNELKGLYHNALIGTLEIFQENGLPVLFYGRMATGDLSFVSGDQYEILWRQPIPRMIPGDLPLKVKRDFLGNVFSVEIEALAEFTKKRRGSLGSFD